MAARTELAHSWCINLHAATFSGLRWHASPLAGPAGGQGLSLGDSTSVTSPHTSEKLWGRSSAPAGM